MGALTDTGLPEPIGQDPGVVYLTFDDGPDQMLTPLLLDLLDRYGAHASFLIGRVALAC